MHGVKSVDYQHYIHLDQVWVLTVALGLAMILGTWAAKLVIEQMPAERWRFVGRPFETLQEVAGVMKRYLQRDCIAGTLS